MITQISPFPTRLAQSNLRRQSCHKSIFDKTSSVVQNIFHAELNFRLFKQVWFKVIDASFIDLKTAAQS